MITVASDSRAPGLQEIASDRLQVVGEAYSGSQLMCSGKGRSFRGFFYEFLCRGNQFDGLPGRGVRLN